jgi:hypothetical protein
MCHCLPCLRQNQGKPESRRKSTPPALTVGPE